MRGIPTGSLLLLLILPGLASAQESYFPKGTKVVARPSASWEACTVSEPIPDSRAYMLRCRTGEYVVPVNRVELANDENIKRTLPPSAAPGMPQVGDVVMASPMSIDTDWRRCVVTQDLTYSNAYGVRCGTSEYTVVMNRVRLATPAEAAEPTPAPQPAPTTTSTPTPAPPRVPGRTPKPGPTPTPTPTPLPLPAPAPTPAPTSNPSPTAIPSNGVNGVIPDGIYLAPVRSSIEVMQVLGGRLALNPKVFLTASTFTAANAGLVGAMRVEGSNLTVTWSDGTKRTGTFTINGRCVSWGYIFCRATPFARGDRLEGDYIASATAGGGVVTSSATLTFRPDGSYRYTATGGISAPAGTSGSAESTSTETGRYEIDGWTLRLRPASGPVRESLTFPYDIYGRFDPIYYNGGLMRKRQ